MNAGTPSRMEYESQGSWAPATPFRPILPTPLPIYINSQANQPDQANWQESECFSSVCTQTAQSNAAFFSFNLANCPDTNRDANNKEVCSAEKMSLNCENVEAHRVFAIDPAAEYTNVSFASLLALANAAAPTDELSISHQHSYDLNFHPGMIPNGASHKIIPEFVPTTPDKSMIVKSKLVPEIENSCTDHRKNKERNELNNVITAEMVKSSRIQCNKQLLEPVTDTSVSAVSTPIGENRNPDREGSYFVDLSKTPQQKPRRKKHRPKVAREGKPSTPKPDGLKENKIGKRKYVRKKGINKDSMSSAADAAGESINVKTLEATMESCRKTLNFGIGPTRDENTIANPRGKRKYVRKKGINKERSTPTEAAAATIDLTTPEPTKESCTKTSNFNIKGQATCQSTFDVVSEPQAKDFCTSKLTVQLGKGIEVPTPKPLMPEPNHSTKNHTGKRKYVRKKGLHEDSTSIPREAAGETNDLKILEPAKKSCRRTLNFDLEGQPADENSSSKSRFDVDSESQGKDIYRRGTQSRSIVQLGEGIEVIVQNTETGIAYDLTRSVNQLIKDYISLPEGQALRTPLPTKTNPQRQKQYADASKENNSECTGQGTADNGQEQTKQILLHNDSQLQLRSLNDPKCRPFTISTEQAQACGSKREYSDALKKVDTSSLNLIDIHCHTLQSYQMSGLHFPNIYKKKRTEKLQNSGTSSTSSSVTAATNITLESKFSQGNAEAVSSAPGLQDKQETLEDMAAVSSTERLKKKRSRGPTRGRDMASLTRIAECAMQQTYPGSQGTCNRDEQQFENSQRPQTCIEALAAETLETLTRKKRTKKRNSLVSSMSSNTNGTQKQQNIILSNQHFCSNSWGTLSELTWKQMFSIDSITEQLKNLYITKEWGHSCQEQNAIVPYYMVDQEQNAIVLYGRDGRLVPVQGSFDVIKKRRQRAKVELDEETNRVWKLLMQNINSEGIDGTDEENAKWWEEERRVFHGRVDSFIARMHLVQGDRRFSQWKGSVVDSVVGVFLTQNVSDHLSSSAFMSVAAKFPVRSKSQKPNCEEGTSSGIEEPVMYILDPEDTTEWNEKMSHKPACDQSYMTIHSAEHNEEKEALSSNDSLESSTGVSLINESTCKLMTSGQSGRETYNYALSSQNSIDSSIAQNAVGTRSSSNSNSETKFSSFNGSNSFVELLQMVGSTMLHEVCNHGNSNASFDENSKDERIRFQTMDYDNRRKKVENLDGPKDFLRLSGILPHSFQPCLNQDFAVEVECYEMSREETRSSGISKNNDKSSAMDQIASTPELASQTANAIKLTVCSPEAARCENTPSSNSVQEDRNLSVHQSQLLGYSKSAMPVGSVAQTQQIEMQQILNSPKLSRETIDAMESSSAFDNQENTRQKTLVDWNKHDISFSKELNEINDATSKTKGRRVGKEKQNDFDWDSLRRQVEVNERKKERRENTMDSVDWEAVRCADVNKIADTIKARGMNNMLAQRIKDFLDRLVRDHGSIDLEWLRDVPPDQAKEYLLSIRGLGLKSVECVRLLTLHHLAFPVDTNVGRIAVRLGWVPLQPLPESLQLHLLELYPVLESIQKYLWPRLCKLDQRTLYELHYQMITFGKVFCTKSKPNCNACPMRGECRHFASAFASSRLALPGLEEKAIVSAKENRTDQNPAMMINELPLPLPQATELSISHQQPQAETMVNNCEPIIEEPMTPEPECIKESENDIEDTLCEDPDEIPTIKLNMKEFTQTLQNYMQENLELQEGDMSKALVALTAEAASIPTPKLKNVSRLRTEHQVYELPDSHPLLEGLDKREPDDPGRYLLAIWTPGETENSIQPPERRCTSQGYGKLCDEKTCFSCNSIRESESQIVRGTLLIPCRTAMRGSFPLNGTYFQVNEVFADHDSSLKPVNVPREWIWNLPRRTVYFGTSVPTIFKGLTTEGIQHCFWRGYVCVRGFDQKTRAPRPLLARLHFPASKLNKVTGKADGIDT